MKVGIIGTGYVGLPTGVGLAELGHDVICIDVIQEKVDALKAGKITLFEDGLEELFHKNAASGKLRFTSDMKEGVENADVVILAVGTPPHPVTKEADMKYVHAAARELARHLTGYTVVANKSTVPVGTGDEVEKIIRDVNPAADFDVVSLPEFLREGFAVHDFFNPDRIIVGANTEKARETIKALYAPFGDKAKMLFVKRRSSETIKYASNAFLAMKIHYITEMANFCEKLVTTNFLTEAQIVRYRIIGIKKEEVFPTPSDYSSSSATQASRVHSATTLPFSVSATRRELFATAHRTHSLYSLIAVSGSTS